jgi:hypothetical protein
MAIIENRMSTVPVQDVYIPPDDIVHGLLEDFEAGPVAVGDPTAGQAFQTWILTWDNGTGDFTITPQTVGPPVVGVTNSADVVQLGLAFDQNGQPTICYNTSTNGFLYWFDSAEPGFVTTDLGTDIESLALTLDDKRDRQTQANDVILWYTKAGLLDFDLFNRVQRERYTVETLMATGVLKTITQVGMHVAWRLQVSTFGLSVPPDPADLPTVESPTSADVENTTATLGGDVTDDGASAITERGTVWGLSANPNIISQAANKNIVAGTTGVFTGPVTGLPDDTLIHYRAYAVNSAGVSYCPDDTFTTEAASTLRNELVSWWPMEEESGTRFDAHASNDLSEPDTVGIRAGIVGNGLDLTGTPDRLTKTDSTPFVGGARSWAFALWIELDRITGADMIPVCAAKTATATNWNWLLQYNIAAARLRFYVASGASIPTVDSDSFGALSTGVKYCVYCQYDHGTGNFGISINDGTLDETASAGTPNAVPTSGFTVGFMNTLNQYTEGMVDELAFWATRVLTTDERTEYFNAGSGITYSDTAP